MTVANVKMRQLAMATEWEILLFGADARYLRSAGEEVFQEIRHLESQLSFFLPDSDTSLLNRHAADRPITVEPRLFHLLEQAASLTRLSAGAFDITIAPLIKCWGFAGGTGSKPEPDAIESALAKVGMRHVVLDVESTTVHFDTDGVLLDFGAIGKGYAIDRSVQILKDLEIESALLHGGTSTVYGLGAPPEADVWKIAIQRPSAPSNSTDYIATDYIATDYIAYVGLRDTALSVSAPHGKWFERDGRRYGHVIDPRTGYPTSNSLLAALVMDSATESDALSTALLTHGTIWLPVLQSLRPSASALIVEECEGENRVNRFGNAWVAAET